MLKILIAIRKYLWIKPKWRILRIYTKQISRNKLERLLQQITIEISQEKNDLERQYLRGKQDFIKLLLK